MTTIYVDNAATTKTSRTAIEAMLPYMDKIYGNPSSLHSVGQAAADALRKAREEAAEVLGCEPNEITFTSGGSEADNQALVSAAAIGARKGKKHIISTAFEHHAILHTLKKLEKEGFEVTLLDVHENGMVSAQQVADAIREDTCLVSVMYANNEIGSIQPIAEIGAVCKEKGVIFHTDAVQAVGHVHINVKEENIDMLSLSAHKFHGPKGVGLLYARKGVRLTNIIEGGAQELEQEHHVVSAHLQLLAQILSTSDPQEINELRNNLLSGEAASSSDAAELVSRHMERVDKGSALSIETSALHLDLLLLFRRVDSILAHGARSFAVS